MRDILDKYPIFVLRHELINVRTGYRLEKKKLTEILKGLKSIKKLTKNELIELLINHSYDISKLPKLEDLQKPKKPKQEPKPKPKIEEKPDVDIYNLYYKKYKEKLPSVEETNSKIDNLNIYYSIREEKEVKVKNEDRKRLKEIAKICYKLINDYDDIKKQLLLNKEKWDDELEAYRDRILARNAKERRNTSITNIGNFEKIDDDQYIKMIDDYITHKMHSFFTFYIDRPDQLQLFKYEKMNEYSLKLFISHLLDDSNSYILREGYDYKIIGYIYNYLLPFL